MSVRKVILSSDWSDEQKDRAKEILRLMLDHENEFDIPGNIITIEYENGARIIYCRPRFGASLLVEQFIAAAGEPRS